MKYLINILLFLIMINTLTVMPIDMKALQIDMSWEKYKAIEAKKENQEQQAAITETVKTSQYELAYSGENYLFNPSQIQIKLSGDEKLADLQSDVISKLTFEWENTNNGDVQTLSVPTDAIKLGQSMGTSIDLTVNLSSLTQIVDGQYKLKVTSKSDLTTSNPPIELQISWIKKGVYSPYTGKGFGKSTAVTFYYPTVDGLSLVPITEPMSSSKTLRKTVTRLLSGAPEGYGLRTGPAIPKIRNIQFKSSKLSLYMTTADIEAAKATGLTAAQMTESISKTFFSFSYIKEISLFVDNKLAGTDLVALETALPIQRSVEAPHIYQVATVGTNILFMPTSKTFASAQDVLTALTQPDITQKGKSTFSPIPANVKLSAQTNPSNAKDLIVDLSITGTLYNSDPKLTQLLLDVVSLNLTKSGFAENVTFTVGGQSVAQLNQVPIKDTYPTPKFINVKSVSL
jgi:hypothetical protein